MIKRYRITRRRRRPMSSPGPINGQIGFPFAACVTGGANVHNNNNIVYTVNVIIYYDTFHHTYLRIKIFYNNITRLQRYVVVNNIIILQ